ncbi:hypothetical protein PHYPSEUDO_012789 [Phytophthora pseudosyringae]|uniref:Uncharacterized protein n=1 Tax=Phytophthora pseudosyringae TaxID=221518 RepID=A0A8T1V9G7_9STRA|nr:hypothetical protein PHYPSEUDO_012789 [Phytophthora pseudosyringae]
MPLPSCLVLTTESAESAVLRVMEEFFQYIGPDGGAALSSALLNRERLFVYSSPREKQIDRCGELRVGSYLACSAVLYYEDHVWLKIRRGYFSNAKNNGYVRVHFEFPAGSAPVDGSDLPPRQHASVAAAQPAQFRHMRRLPEFPTFMCARDRLVLHREPVFNLHSASVSSSESKAASGSTPRHMQRFLPPVSVFQATECRFNQDFTQLAVKVTSAFAGLGGWINASFHKTLVEVEDPRRLGFFRNGPVYLQNVAGRGGKWAGELPVRAIPSLQAPRLYNVESYRVVRAIERKLLKDRVWVRIQPLKSQQEVQQGGEKKSEEDQPVAEAGENQEEEERASETAGPDAWVIERNANTAQRVMVPWGSNRIQDVPANNNAERYYRTVYSRRPLPLRRTADLQAEVVGHLEPGSVFSSTQRVLNDRGHMWIRVPLPSEKPAHISKDASEYDDEDNNAGISSPDNNAEESKEEEEEFEDLGQPVRYGYAIQSNAKTNTCMVQEIPAPGKMNPKQYYQVVLSSDDAQPHTKSSNQEGGTAGSRAPENTIAAHAEATNSAKELFYVKNGAILSAIGTVFNAEQGQMWLQVLATELDPAMRVKRQWPLSDAEQKLNVVYLPMCDPNRSSPETVLKPVHHELAKIDNPLKAEKDGSRSPSRVVFSGRASKLFGSHLLRPSTIDLRSTFQKNDTRPGTLSSGVTVPDPVARAAGEDDRAQSLKDEITAWQLGLTGNRVTQLYTQIGSLASYTLSCVRRPFASCLAHQEAKRRYRQLDQEVEGMEEYALDDDDVRV